MRWCVMYNIFSVSSLAIIVNVVNYTRLSLYLRGFYFGFKLRLIHFCSQFTSALFLVVSLIVMISLSVYNNLILQSFWEELLSAK